MVRPRYEEASSEAYEMLAKAQELLKKADMSMKDKYCMKRFGKKYSECSSEQKSQCDKSVDKVEKGEHHKETSFDTRPSGVQFVSESGGQTFNAQYQTNQSLLDSDDVANKGASSSSVNMEAESSSRNPHDNINRLVEG